jgi:hypothetical protein
MAAHKKFTVATDVSVYFCDPKSTWQRGTSENTNRLLRQYLPRRTDFSVYSQHDLDLIALKLNTRPRKTLGYKHPGCYAGQDCCAHQLNPPEVSHRSSSATYKDWRKLLLPKRSRGPGREDKPPGHYVRYGGRSRSGGVMMGNSFYFGFAVGMSRKAGCW